MKMKKIAAIVFSAMMMLNMGTAVFAEGIQDVQDIQPTIKKTYQVNHGTAPAETFTYNFVPVSYTNGDGETVAGAEIPAIAPVTIAFDQAISETTVKEVDVPINVANYQLGTYTYNVSEASGNTAGVSYSEENLYLVLTIIRDEDSNKHYVAALHYEDANGSKTDNDLTNNYDSGSLTVTKHIAGNMAEMSKKFAFTISFANPAGREIKSAISTDATSGTWSADGLTYTIDLGNNESVKFDNIPAGVSYTVGENSENYTSDKTDDKVQGDIAASDADTVSFTNTLTNGTIDTGINLDSMPYIMILCLVAVCAVVLFVRKRTSANR